MSQMTGALSLCMRPLRSKLHGLTNLNVAQAAFLTYVYRDYTGKIHLTDTVTPICPDPPEGGQLVKRACPPTTFTYKGETWAC